MTKRLHSGDFRATRTLLPDEVFLLVNGPRPGPTDLVPEDVWNGIMHLPDDVALTTSNHHGAQLAALHALWGGWIEAIGDKQDELFSGMLEPIVSSRAHSTLCMAFTDRRCRISVAPLSLLQSACWEISHRTTGTISDGRSRTGGACRLPAAIGSSAV
jgi:hypothetical protein